MNVAVEDDVHAVLVHEGLVHETEALQLLEAEGVGAVPGIVELHNDPGRDSAVHGSQVLCQPVALGAVLLVVWPAAGAWLTQQQSVLDSDMQMLQQVQCHLVGSSARKTGLSRPLQHCHTEVRRAQLKA